MKKYRIEKVNGLWRLNLPIAGRVTYPSFDYARRGFIARQHREHLKQIKMTPMVPR